MSLSRDVPYTFHKLAAKFWPGPLTLLVEASTGVPLKVTAHTGNVAVRWPKSPIVDALIDLVKGPITGTSGNISGQPACATAVELLEQMGDRLPLIIDAGETPGNLASTIVKLEGDDWEIMREGVSQRAGNPRRLEDDAKYNRRSIGFSLRGLARARTTPQYPSEMLRIKARATPTALQSSAKNRNPRWEKAARC